MVPPLGADGKEASYLPHHGNVCDNSKFNVPYVKSFDLVLNALDNVGARRRVNRLCLAASVPLVEAGTAGYLGQVTVIDRPSGTECYECQAKPAQKVYPICTIRSTPSQPVHCIVWAKELYKLCFGPDCGESMLFEDEESLRADSEAAEREKAEGAEEDGGEKDGADGGDSDKADGAAAGGEKSTYMDAVSALRGLMSVGPTGGDAEPSAPAESSVRSAARAALTALFADEIRKQIGMDRYRTADRAPVPVGEGDLASCLDASVPPPSGRDGSRPTDVWTGSDCVAEMAACFAEVASSPAPPLPEFDKDDGVAMRFVASASNLRSRVFGIEPQSMYGAKGIAGNIIPAIATTNAICAGLQVLQAFRILRVQLDERKRKGGEGEEREEAVKEEANDGEEEGRETVKSACRYIYCLRDRTRRGYYLQPTSLPGPNPGCFVCRNAVVSLSLNTSEWTLGMLIDRVLKRELGFQEPTVEVGGDIVYEEGDDVGPDEWAANLPRRLVDLPGGGVGHGGCLTVEDFTQDLEAEIAVSHRSVWTVKDDDGNERPDDREEIERFELGGPRPVVAAAPAESGAGGGTGANEEGGDDGDDDDIEIVADDNDAPSGKRGGDGGAAAGPPAKRARTDGGDDDDDVEIVIE